MNQRLNYILIALCMLFSTLTFVAVGLTFYRASFEKSYLSYPDGKFKVLNETTNGMPLHPGDTVSYNVQRCNSSSEFHSFRLARMLISDKGDSVLLPGMSVPIAPGCTTSVSNITVLPTELRPGIPLPTGRYMVLGVSTTEGVSQNFDVHWQTSWFEVVQ